MSAPTVTIGGTPLTPELAVLLRVVTVDAALNLPAVATVELDDPAGAVLAAAGAEVGAALAVSYLGTALFTGEVTGLECRFDGTGQVAVVVGYDAAYKLQRHHATTAFPAETTYSEVISAAAQAAGVPLGTLDVPGTTLPYCARVAEDGWSFVLRMAAEVDRDVVVNAGALDVVPRAPASSAPDAASITAVDPLALHVSGGRVLRLRVAVSGNDQVTSTTVRGWDPTTKQEVVATAAAPGTSPGAQPGGAAPASTAETLGTAEVTIPAPGVTTSDLATALATSAASRAGERIAEADVEVVGTPSLAPGTVFAIGGAGPALNGGYTATAVRHVFDRELGYRTHVHVGSRPVPPRPAATAGVVPAVVVDNNDTEGNLGRVKVRFDWLDATFVSDWLRVVQPGATNAAGLQVVPEVGDEVLVGFSDDAMRAPYVLGALFNGVDLPKVDWPSVVVDGKVVQRVFTSRTGHRLTFVDEDGEKGTVMLATGDGSTTVELTQGQAGLTVTSTHDVAVTTNGKATVTADGDVTVESKQGVTVQAGTALTLKALSVSVEADGALTLKGATVSVEGSTAVRVTGQVVQLN